MATQTILLDFTIPDDGDITQCQDTIVSNLNDHIKAAGIKGELCLEMKHIGAKVVTSVYCGPGDTMVSIRANTDTRLVTVNIEGLGICPSGNQFKDGHDLGVKLWAGQPDLGSYVSGMAGNIGVTRYNWLPAITRGLEMSPYWTTTDDRIIEAPITEVLHDHSSQYQRIQILDTVDYGRLLMLDGQTQLAESDDVYTKTLMSDVDYNGAEVLILGGGDGALLAQLITDHSPAMVTMVELDGDVMRIVREHMASVTLDTRVLDNHRGENYQIITGDAIKYLEDSVKDDKQFNFIFGDLTDVPIDTDTEAKELWDFIAKILKLSLSRVKKGGQYLTHVSGKSLPAVRKTFEAKVEEIAETLNRKVTINFSEAFVPSFMEAWVFSQVTVIS